MIIRVIIGIIQVIIGIVLVRIGIIRAIKFGQNNEGLRYRSMKKIEIMEKKGN